MPHDVVKCHAIKHLELGLIYAIKLNIYIIKIIILKHIQLSTKNDKYI